jgi:hypothetical protein
MNDRNTAILFFTLMMSSISHSFAGTLADCTFPNSQEEAPIWVCDAPVDGMEVGEVGMSHSTDMIVGMTNAITAAREQLVQLMQADITRTLKQSSAEKIISPEKMERIISSATKQIRKEIIERVRLYRALQRSDGSIYVLLGLDSATYDAFQQLSQNVINSNKAANP